MQTLENYGIQQPSCQDWNEFFVRKVAVKSFTYNESCIVALLKRCGRRLCVGEHFEEVE